jgi:hypothetical protein
MNVLLHPNGEDITFVASTNHLKKMWIVHALTLVWPYCHYPLEAQAIICKHVMKFFKMLLPNIGGGSIVKEIGTSHGVV